MGWFYIKNNAVTEIHQHDSHYTAILYIYALPYVARFGGWLTVKSRVTVGERDKQILCSLKYCLPIKGSAGGNN